MDIKPISQGLKWPIHIEVRLKQKSKACRFDTVQHEVHKFIMATTTTLCIPGEIPGWSDVAFLKENVEQIVTTESSCPLRSVPIAQAHLEIHVYRLAAQSDIIDEMETLDPSDGPEEATNVKSTCELPNKAWEGLWDTLIFSEDIKSKLLNYIYATFVFSDAGVDFNKISWNRIALLHGPPGTGKTSLARALAQKLAVRLSSRYSMSRLLEINSHSLFSRWFSESGKLVQRLFESIIDLLEDDDCFVVVLIDEIESLTAARASAMSGVEPSDALRVVNALLTQLDKLKHRKNVLVLATSNLTKAIDDAFMDRADIIQYIGLPQTEAIYEILRSCLLELMDKGLIEAMPVPTAPIASVQSRSLKDENDDAVKSVVGLTLLRLADRCVGMSGRTLRRLPVLAHARYMGSGYCPVVLNGSATANGHHLNGRVGKQHGSALAVRPSTVEHWLEAMERVISDHEGEKTRVNHV